jgi:hypothetical protein
MGSAVTRTITSTYIWCDLFCNLNLKNRNLGFAGVQAKNGRSWTRNRKPGSQKRSRGTYSAPHAIPEFSRMIAAMCAERWKNAFSGRGRVVDSGLVAHGTVRRPRKRPLNAAPVPTSKARWNRLPNKREQCYGTWSGFGSMFTFMLMYQDIHLHIVSRICNNLYPPSEALQRVQREASMDPYGPCIIVSRIQNNSMSSIPIVPNHHFLALYQMQSKNKINSL